MPSSLPLRRGNLTRFAWLAIGGAVLTMGLKTSAWMLTGSVGLLSDALESGVNLFAAMMALYILRVAAQPADEEHAYGHAKAEYFAAGIEGTLIIAAAAAILWTSLPRLIHPAAVEQVGLGLLVVGVATLANFFVSRTLIGAGTRYTSITLEADGRHLMTDVWTSLAVIVAVGAVAVTDIQRLDPIIAIFVAGNIIFAGAKLIARSTGGLMDQALPKGELAAIRTILDSMRQDGVNYHALRTRRSGHHSFMSVHVLVPGAWSVQRGHDFVERIENQVEAAIPNITVLTHLEPIEDPTSFKDERIAPERGLEV